MEKKNNNELINEGTTIKVVDITGKLNNYVTLDEFMKRTAFMENEKPDVVIVLYNQEDIREPDGNTRYIFDLR